VRRLSIGLVTAMLLALLSSPPASAEEAAAPPEPPEWAQRLRLVIHGGPAASDVEITLNGQFVILVQDEPEWFHEIADLVKPGVNELKLTLKKPDAPRGGGDDLTITVREVAENARKVVTKGEPLAEITVPASAASDPSCEASVRFWAGPVPGPAPEGLKNSYWLYATGPSAHVAVAVIVNDRLVYETSSGQAWFDITPFVHKGKNTATFELRPTCLVSDIGTPGSLVVGIGPARLRGHTVEMTEPPQAEVEVDPKRDKTEKVVRRSFRAW
jgi:hypothetical protein